MLGFRSLFFAALIAFPAFQAFSKEHDLKISSKDPVTVIIDSGDNQERLTIYPGDKLSVKVSRSLANDMQKKSSQDDPKSECLSAYGQTMCGYGCESAYGRVVCGSEPGMTCKSGFGRIECGYGCQSAYGMIKCSQIKGGICSVNYGRITCDGE